VTPLYNYLIISALGANRPNILSELSGACLQCGCNLLNSKVTVLGQELSLTLFVAGNWGAIAKMEALLPSLEQRLVLNLHTRRTQVPIFNSPMMIYIIQIIAIDKSGILNGLSDFLLKQGIPIEELSGHTYSTSTDTRMVSLSLKINVPDTVHLATLREQFMMYCDDNNLDGFMEPWRSDLT